MGLCLVISDLCIFSCFNTQPKILWIPVNWHSPLFLSETFPFKHLMHIPIGGIDQDITRNPICNGGLRQVLTIVHNTVRSASASIHTFLRCSSLFHCLHFGTNNIFFELSISIKDLCEVTDCYHCLYGFLVNISSLQHTNKTSPSQ